MATATACDNASDVESTSDYDDVHDTSWQPDFDELEDDGAPVTDVSNSSDRVSNFLLIGFHCLMRLLTKCMECGSECHVIRKVHCGFQLHLTLLCSRNREIEWKSCETVRQRATLNVIVPAAAVLCGLTFTPLQHFFQCMDLMSISLDTYFRVQRRLICPIVRHRWEQMMCEILVLLQDDVEPVIAADGQFDSSGHCAKYCTVMFVHMNTGLVCGLRTVQVSMCSSSAAMEQLAFTQLLNWIEDHHVVPHLICTDRHSGIRKFMSKQRPHIIHEFDAWHMAKSLLKALSKACHKSVEVQRQLGPWVKSIVAHLWYCSAKCDRSHGMVSMFVGITNHVVNVHK